MTTEMQAKQMIWLSTKRYLEAQLVEWRAKHKTPLFPKPDLEALLVECNILAAIREHEAQAKKKTSSSTENRVCECGRECSCGNDFPHDYCSAHLPVLDTPAGTPIITKTIPP